VQAVGKTTIAGFNKLNLKTDYTDLNCWLCWSKWLCCWRPSAQRFRYKESWAIKKF